ncbi:hypothetical protein XENOCAPTIV_010094 [Xenoophorus captivus]|uniref:Atos-like C-terminal domain-containing protein n=1 Tax=Xenoophorus captivus TaxID=1517983 RepID=A0ABV0RZM4_9TELE
MHICVNATATVCPKGDEGTDESHQLFSTSAPPASLSLLGNFEGCVTSFVGFFFPMLIFSCLISTRFQSSKSGKLYLHRDIRLLFSRKSMEVDSGAAYELQSFTESPIDPPFSSRC